MAGIPQPLKPPGAQRKGFQGPILGPLPGLGQRSVPGTRTFTGRDPGLDPGSDLESQTLWVKICLILQASFYDSQPESSGQRQDALCLVLVHSRVFQDSGIWNPISKPVLNHPTHSSGRQVPSWEMPWGCFVLLRACACACVCVCVCVCVSILTLPDPLFCTPALWSPPSISHQLGSGLELRGRGSFAGGRAGWRARLAPGWGQGHCDLASA